jgi:hypothetical protein
MLTQDTLRFNGSQALSIPYPTPYRYLPMYLWTQWWNVVSLLRPAFSRARTFQWFVLVLVTFSVRSDLAGVTSFVRALCLKEHHYHRLLSFFHSSAVDLDLLTSLWLATVMRLFPVHRVNGMPVAILDGIKYPKEGKKMPAVKGLHQQSESNSKPHFIMGHSFQVFGILCRVSSYYFCVPICARIHEGIVFSNRDSKTLIDKAGLMLKDAFSKTHAFLLVADAYYANGKMIKSQAANGTDTASSQLVTRVRSNAVAYEAPVPIVGKRKRGRPKKYGCKKKLRSLFKSTANFINLNCPVYGEVVCMRYACFDLLWKPVGCIVRFVLVEHPSKGRMILMSTDLSLCPKQIIELYALRFKIEVTFRHAVHNVGAFGYHFWMRSMSPLKRRDGNQHLHRKTKEYREKVIRKMRAYHCFVQTGLIAQGMLQYLSMTCEKQVWQHFGTWIRTIRPGVLPSEAVVSDALKNTLPDFLASSITGLAVEKFISSRIDRKRASKQRLVA